MILTKKQEEGLRIAVERYKNNEPWTCISGYAGSGKSTLIKFIIAALDLTDEEVCYVAFTGKAATVLQKKGCPNATTAHKLLYKARQKADGTFVFIPKTKFDLEQYKVIVVDEVSMLPIQMWNKMLEHKIHIIATGDPGQLPPIDKEADNHVLDHPHIFLDEIMRQAQDSEIIRLSMWVREGKDIKNFPCENKQVQIFSESESNIGMYNWADQVLCATNNTRNSINNFMRKEKGFGLEPAIGDKIIGLHNHWEYFSNTGNSVLTNGTIGYIENYEINMRYLPRYISSEPIAYMHTNIKVEDEDNEFFYGTPIDYKALTKNEPALTPRQSYLMKKNKNITIEPPFDFAYAYAITTHKAQGSEWDKVLVVEERFPFDKEEHIKWLYTAATRAKEKLVIIRK